MERIWPLFFIFKPHCLCPIPQLSRPFHFAFCILHWFVPRNWFEKELKTCYLLRFGINYTSRVMFCKISFQKTHLEQWHDRGREGDASRRLGDWERLCGRPSTWKKFVCGKYREQSSCLAILILLLLCVFSLSFHSYHFHSIAGLGMSFPSSLTALLIFLPPVSPLLTLLNPTRLYLFPLIANQYLQSSLFYFYIIICNL